MNLIQSVINMLIVVALVLLFLMVSHVDYEAELDQQELYCEMTEAGHWGAYDESIDCGE